MDLPPYARHFGCGMSSDVYKKSSTLDMNNKTNENQGTQVQSRHQSLKLASAKEGRSLPAHNPGQSNVSHNIKLGAAGYLFLRWYHQQITIIILLIPLCPMKERTFALLWKPIEDWIGFLSI